MGILDAISDSIYSATYNADAEKAKKEDQASADVVREEITKLLKSYDEKSYEWEQDNKVPSSLKELKDFLTAEDDYLKKNPRASEADLKERLRVDKEQLANIEEKKNILYDFLQYQEGLQTTLDVLVQKDRIRKEDKKKYEDKLNELKGVNQTEGQKMVVPELRAFRSKFIEDMHAILNGIGVDPNFEKKTSRQIEEEKKQNEESENATFSLSRFLGKIFANMGSFVSRFLMVTLALVCGMLAANDAIARKPAYRILNFLYGSAFFFVVIFYYLYRYMAGTAPKIYTLLPLTSTPAETTLGKYLLYPFYFESDKSVTESIRGFLKESADLVGEKMDPSELNGLAGNGAAGADGSGGLNLVEPLKIALLRMVPAAAAKT